MLGKPCILSLFLNSFDKFNKTSTPVRSSIYWLWHVFAMRWFFCEQKTNCWNDGYENTGLDNNFFIWTYAYEVLQVIRSYIWLCCSFLGFSFCPTFSTLLPSFIMLFFSRVNSSFCPTFSTLLPSFISTRPIQRNTSLRPRSWTKFVSTATSFTHLLNCSHQPSR